MKSRVHFSMDFKHDFDKFTCIRDTLDWTRIEPLPFLQPDAWDRLTRAGDDFVMRWIDKQISSADAVVVLIGAQTYTRALVRFEISRAFQLRRAVIGVSLRGMPNSDGTVLPDRLQSPFDYVVIAQANAQRAQPRMYDWIGNSGPTAFPTWLTTFEH